MPINPMQIMQLLQNSQNPQQMVLNMLKDRASENPQYANLLQIIEMKNGVGLEDAVRQMMAAQGVDFDKEFNAFRRNWRL